MYQKLRKEYDIQTKGIHFLNIIDLQYNPETKTPAGFYNEYRRVILNNVRRRNEIIQGNGNRALEGDKTVGPLFEDAILMKVLNLIDPRLPKFVRKHYQLKMGDRRLMDIKSDIFTNLKEFISEMEAAEQLSSIRLKALTSSTASLTLAALNARGTRGRS